MKEKIIKINLTKKQLYELRSILEEYDLSTLKETREIKEIKLEGEINIAKIVIKCYNLLKFNSYMFENETVSYKVKIEEYLNKIDISELEKILNEYSDENSYGYHIIEEKIKINDIKN